MGRNKIYSGYRASLRNQHRTVRDAEIDILRYQLLDTQGKLCITTLRQSGELAFGKGALGGYHVAMIDTHLNMVNHLLAFTAMYYLKPHLRGKGLGKELFIVAERNIKREWPTCLGIYAASKLSLDNSASLKAAGYIEDEIMLVKWFQPKAG